MKKVNLEWVKEWKGRREKGESYGSIAKDYPVSGSTVRYHINPKARRKEIEKVKKWMKKRSKGIGATEKRPPWFYAYQLKDRERVKQEIISEFRKIETKEGLELFLHEKEPLFSLYLLKKPSIVNEIKNANKFFSSIFEIDPVNYDTLKRRLYNLCYNDLVERLPVPRSSQIYKITRRGLRYIERGTESTKIVLEILRDNPEGLPPATLAVLFGIEKYGEPIPQPYYVSVNGKYRYFVSVIVGLLRSKFIKKEKKSRQEMIELGSQFYGFERRVITKDELTKQAEKILSYVRKEGKVSIQSLREQYDLSFKTARMYLSGLACTGFIENVSKETYSAIN